MQMRVNSLLCWRKTNWLPQNPREILEMSFFGHICNSQLFGSAAAVLHYNCLRRAIATAASPVLENLCVEYYTDFGVVVPRALAKAAISSFARFNGRLPIMLEKGKSEAGSIS